MIGSTASLTGVTSSTSIPATTLYVPLQFWLNTTLTTKAICVN